MRLFFFAFSCCLSLAACTKKPTPPPGRHVVGVVRFEGAAKPEKFSVSLADRTEWFTSTDGSFRLANITDRLATLHFEAQGFASANVYTALPEQGEARVEATMYPACAVLGVVRDANAEAIAGALVTVAHAEKTLYWFQRPTAQSGADGSFELGDVPPGRAYLSISATGLERGFVGPIDVAREKPPRVEHTLKKAVAFSGKVRRGEAPVADATVELHLDRTDADALGLVYTPTETDDEGRFAISDSGPGMRRLIVRVVNAEDRERGLQRAVQVDVPEKGVTDFDVDLASGSTRLVVTFPSGEPGELLVVQGKFFADRALDLESLLGTVHYAQVATDDRRVTFERVASGDHTLILMPPPEVRLLPGGCHCIQAQIAVAADAKEMSYEMTGTR